MLLASAALADRCKRYHLRMLPARAGSTAARASRLGVGGKGGGAGRRGKPGRSGGTAAAAPGDRVVLDRGVHKLAKDCLHCERPMTWRKKWERNWDSVVYCSDKCRKDAAAQRRRSSRETETEVEQSTPPQSSQDAQ